jgi:hypothetical protein
MERFVLTTKKHKKAYKFDLVLELVQVQTNQPGISLMLKQFTIPYTGPSASETKINTVLRVAERRGMLFNAEKQNSVFPANFDGSAREFVNVLFDRNNVFGELGIEHHDGMRLAMAFMLAGKCNTVTKMNKVVDGIVNLEEEVVLYFFTLMAYGNRQKAGRAALYALLTTKN